MFSCIIPTVHGNPLRMRATSSAINTLAVAALAIRAAGCAMGFDADPVQRPQDGGDVPVDSTWDVPPDVPVELQDTADATDAEADCAAPYTDCSGECVDLGSDTDNCGTCGHECPAPYSHTVATCEEGECGVACQHGWVDNDGDPGCETACAGSGVETCNGLDDDCDGSPDDGYACVLGTDVACLTTCGSVGTGTCTASCLLPAPLECDPPEETCNGLDDDCDDVADDGFDPPCTGCTPDCDGRECGPDPVCEESCGECTPPDTCNAAGQCVCTPDCTGRTCGLDPVCHLSCGTCTPPAVCSASGNCVCTPNCDGRECGPDPVCGTSCGACTLPETCNALGSCVCLPDCGTRECGLDPACGASCGTCVLPETCDVTGTCACTPSCGSRVCGPDPVCGHSCGICAPPLVCNSSGLCVPSCTPDCSGRVCGPDPVCSTSCGLCTSPLSCNAAGQCVCIPDCTGRSCGPDPVCGLSCGSCTFPLVCNGLGQCECVPDCTGRECGPDAYCGTSCGTCVSPETCNGSGICTCVPDCTGLECGPDPVCGQSCGTCTAPETCNASGACECIPSCAGRECGDDGCGGTCGTCLSNETCDGTGHCVCVPACTGLECGPDTCGGTCGNCVSPETCDPLGQCNQCAPVVRYGFDASAEGWISGGYGNDWARGAPTSGPLGDINGPGGLWATDLAGNAATCADSWIESPAIDLSPYAGRTITLVFWTWYEFSPCDVWFVHEDYSGGVVEVWNGSSWTYLTPIGGYGGGSLELSDGTGDPPPCSGLANSIDGRTGFYPRSNNLVWRRIRVNLTSYATSGIKVRMHFGAHDKYICNPYTDGWYVDEVSIVVDPC